MKTNFVRRSAVLDLRGLSAGQSRRERVLRLFRERPTGSLPVNNKWQMRTSDPDLAYLIKKGVLTVSRDGGKRQQAMNKSSHKRQTYLRLAEEHGGGKQSLTSGDGVRLIMYADERRPGWVKALSDADIKVTHRPGRFGRTHWLLKRNHVALEVLQSPTQAMATPLNGLPAEALALAEHLVYIGIAALAPAK